MQLHIIGFRTLAAVFAIFSVTGCEKIVDIPEPIDTITTEKIFSTPANANTAVAGIYYKMSNAKQLSSPFNGLLTIYPGLSADELEVSQGGELLYQKNSILVGDDKFWGRMYGIIYSANAVIEGLNASTTLTNDIKNQYIGEAKFIRALCYFYLANIFGDVPLITSTEFAESSIASRISMSKVYEHMIDDLSTAKELLATDYSVSNGQRIRANKSVASALLARVYLYNQEWAKAEDQATAVILNSQYTLESNLQNVFKKNSIEAIFQLQISDEDPFATFEGFQFVPEYITRDYDSVTVAQNWQYFVPNYRISSQLINAFEPGDIRKLNWVDSTGLLNGNNYFFPSKYRDRRVNSVSEYVTLLRLSEQYLIRAEARARQNKLSEAVNDINVIRLRAGIASISSISQEQILDAIKHERRIELLAECGHRWFDLKRWDNANDELGSLKGSDWQPTDQLYPIPLSELLLNPKLTQNPGYE